MVGLENAIAVAGNGTAHRRAARVVPMPRLRPTLRQAVSVERHAHAGLSLSPMPRARL